MAKKVGTYATREEAHDALAKANKTNPKAECREGWLEDGSREYSLWDGAEVNPLAILVAPPPNPDGPTISEADAELIVEILLRKIQK